MVRAYGAWSSGVAQSVERGKVDLGGVAEVGMNFDLREECAGGFEDECGEEA